LLRGAELAHISAADLMRPGIAIPLVSRTSASNWSPT